MGDKAFLRTRTVHLFGRLHLLGAFTTTTLMKLAQRAVDRKLSLGDVINDGPV